jgi:hypothetical protein
MIQLAWRELVQSRQEKFGRLTAQLGIADATLAQAL